MGKKFEQKTGRRVNEQITGYPVARIVGEGFEPKIMQVREALEKAYEMGLDLIEINSSANPPVLKIANYSKMVYEEKKQKKKERLATSSELKEIQLSVAISRHDMETKCRKTREFIEDGDKVKVVLRFRGRELQRKDENKRSLYEFIEMASEFSQPESLPKDEGNRMMVILKKKK